ncbi:MAG: nucleotide exchange factor GrpE [Minwuia sp.]|nr:nucleotide exchange factor GrpE [Minwuia sp.]
MTDENKKEAAAEAANDDANPDQANPAETPVEGVESEQADAGDPDVGIEVGLPEEDQIAELTAEVAALKDRLVRTYADLENTRKRAERDRQDALKFGATKFARDMCEVADNLRRALSSVPEDAGDANLVALTEGVKVTQAALSQIFERHGVKQIEAREQKFDPNLHEAMTEIEIPGAPPGTCVDVIEEGYTLNGRLLRPARVVVAKGNPAAGPTVDTSA